MRGYGPSTLYFFFIREKRLRSYGVNLLYHSHLVLDFRDSSLFPALSVVSTEGHQGPRIGYTLGYPEVALDESDRVGCLSKTPSISKEFFGFTLSFRSGPFTGFRLN